MKQAVTAVVVGLWVGAALCGCAKTAEQAPEGPAPTLQQRISEIENDPNMPPQAKAAAIAAMRQQEAMAAAQAKGSGTAQEAATKARK